MSGLSVTLDVNEVDINQLQSGQKATITGSAFPGITLQGYVEHIEKQASSKNSNLPTFTTHITIPQLTAEQAQVIHVGMSAKIKINLEENDVIMIPIKAVFQENGQSKVKVKNELTNQIDSIPVITGKTNLSEVSIEQGLRPGDVIVFTN